MKIAITGKGGSGKTTIAAGLIKLFAEKKRSVIAVDCDPDISLGLALDFPEYTQIKPICEMKDLISQRTETYSGQPQGFFKINPKVDDIPDKFCPHNQGVGLIVMGKVDKPSGGCLCPENTFVRSLVAHLVLQQDEVVILDMVAGSEHLGRATARGVDVFLIVVEPSEMSIQTALHIQDLAKGLGIGKILYVANKVKNESDSDFINSSLKAKVSGSVSVNKTLEQARGKFVFDDTLRKEFENIYDKLAALPVCSLEGKGRNGGE